MAKRIAFLGLGNMGGAVAANMMKAGFEVVGYDPSPAAQEAAREAGMARFSILPPRRPGRRTTCAVQCQGASTCATLFWGRRARCSPRKKARCVSISPPSCPRRASPSPKRPRARGFHFLDAPISGNAIIARDKKIGFMVGGDKEVLDAHRAVLDCACELLDYFGPERIGTQG